MLPIQIIKMLIDFLAPGIFSLIFCVHMHQWSSCLGSFIKCESILHITRLHNCGVSMISEYDHVSHHRFALGWIPAAAGSVIQHLSLVTMYQQDRDNHCLLLSPPIDFGQLSS